MTKTLYVQGVACEWETGEFVLEEKIDRVILNDILNIFASTPCNTCGFLEEAEGETEQELRESEFLEHLDGKVLVGFHGWDSEMDKDVTNAILNFTSRTTEEQRDEFISNSNRFYQLCSQSSVENDVPDFTNLDKQSRRL